MRKPTLVGWDFIRSLLLLTRMDPSLEEQAACASGTGLFLWDVTRVFDLSIYFEASQSELPRAPLTLHSLFYFYISLCQIHHSAFVSASHYFWAMMSAKSNIFYTVPCQIHSLGSTSSFLRTLMNSECTEYFFHKCFSDSKCHGLLTKINVTFSSVYVPEHRGI